MNHTNSPWRFQMLGSEGGRIYPDYGDIRERGKFIAVVNGRSTQEDQANGDFIVRAVNAHHDLAEALEAANKELELAYAKLIDLDPHFQAGPHVHAKYKREKAITKAKGCQV